MALKSSGLVVTMALVLLMGGVDAAGAVSMGGRCGPILNGLCDPGLFCNRLADTCNQIGGTGICVPIPAVCPKLKSLLPVCGCNGTNYANDCERIKALQQKAHDGPCK